jgi:hypothetical protein
VKHLKHSGRSLPTRTSRPTWTTPLARVIGIVVASFFAGSVIVSIGVGSELTTLNTVMSPLVCAGDVIVPAWEYRGRPSLANGPALRTRWICVNEASGAARVEGYRTTLTAGAVYGLFIAIALGFWQWRVASQGDRKDSTTSA